MASALLLSLASYSNAQETGTTGNLIQDNTWAGCWTATSGAFWGGQRGGPCPGISNGGYDGSNQIIFSYQQQTLSQTDALAKALPNSGTGLQVNGYNWHWHVKNSNTNGAQPGDYDPIAYVTVDLLSSTGSILESDRYDYGYHIPTWIKLSGTRTYDNPYSLTSADSIQLSVTGKDSGFWAGYYGPEFQHITLSVNYSVDPCASNPLYSPTCSGYMAALAALTPQSTEPTSTEPTAVVESSTPTAEVSTTSPTPVVIESQIPAVTATATSSSRNVGSGLSISSILSIVRNEQSRISSVESAAVQQANEQAAQATSDAQQQAESVASLSEQQSVEQSLQVSSNAQQQSETVVSNVITNQSQLLIQPTQSQQSNIEINNLNQNTSEVYSLTTGTETESATQSIGLTGNSPTGNLFESEPVVVQEENNQTTESTVNSNVADNDIAGDVSIASLQIVPIGFDLYQVGLTDVDFYKPKDIYKNQKNVDNARAFRGLAGGGVLYNQMVDSQYKESD